MNMNKKITTKDMSVAISGKLSRFFGVSVQDATKEQLYKAVVMTVRDILLQKRNDYHQTTKKDQSKKVYYLCINKIVK